MTVRPGIILLRAIITWAALWVMGHYEVWACPYTPSDPLYEEKQQCDLRPDRSWSCQLHRCKATSEVLSTQNAFQRCDEIEETIEANRCRSQVAREVMEAEKGVDLGQNQVETKNRFGMSVHSFVGAYYIFSGFSMEKAKAHCSISAHLMAAGSGTAVFGTLLANWKQKRGTRQLQDQYQKLVENSHPQSAQVGAFDYLIQEQELVEEAADRFFKVNVLASGLLTSAAIVATSGMLFGTEGGTCSTTSGGEEGRSIIRVPFTPFVPFIEEFLTMAQQVLLPTVEANFLETLVPSGTGLGLAGLIAYGKSTKLERLKRLLQTPLGRVVLASVGAAASFRVANLYRREAREAKKRKKMIEEMRDAFVKRVGFYDCSTRQDPRQPQCFCFIRENLLNPKRSSSETCQQYFNPQGEAPQPTTYPRGQNLREAPTGCLTRQGKFDPECRCQKQLSSGGDNNCQKITLNPTALSFGGLGPTVGKFLKTANALTSGKAGLDALQESSLGQGAAKLRQALKKISYLADKKLKKKAKKGFPFNDAHIRKGMAKVYNSLGPQAMSLAKGFRGALSSGPVELSPSKKVALREVSGKIYSLKKKEKKKSGGPSWGFNDQKRQTSSSELEYGKEEYDYGKHDIHSEEGESLWKILSHRYHQTGLSRLFE